MAKRGPKSKYQPGITPKVVNALAKAGLIDTEISAVLGINKATLNRWKTAHPEMRDSLKEGKDDVDERVEQALYRNALGLDEHNRHTRVPNVTAQIFWLKCRKRDQYGDKVEIARKKRLEIETIPGLDYDDAETLRRENDKLRDELRGKHDRSGNAETD